MKRSNNQDGKYQDKQNPTTSKKYRGKQGRKDNSQPRINLDNERVSKLFNDIKETIRKPGVHSNEIRYYNKRPELLEGAARLQFYNIVGNPVGEGFSDGALNFRTAGVMGLTWSPQIGGKLNDYVINRATQDYYSYVVHANSRNTSYDPNDLMLMTLGVAEIFSALTLGIKVFGLMKHYKEENRYLPGALILASGFAPDDLLKNYSHMWFDLNQLIASANTLWIPNDMPFVERRIWMNQNVFTDANGSKAQLYTFKPWNFYRYEPIASSEGGQLNAYLTPSTIDNDPFVGIYKLTWTQYVSTMQALIKAINDQQYRGVMMGDILKAYGADKLLTMAPIALDYATPVVYDPLVLSQIENATVSKMAVSTFQASAATGEIVAFPYTTTIVSSEREWQGAPKEVVLNVHHPEQPTTEEITEITRLTCVGSYVTEGTTPRKFGCMPLTCGTENICSALIYKLVPGGYATYSFISCMPDLVNIGSTTNDIAIGTASYGIFSSYPTARDTITALAQFDWSPITYWSTAKGGPGGEEQEIYPIPDSTMLVDLDNYTSVSHLDINRIHSACIYSEFGMGHENK